VYWHPFFESQVSVVQALSSLHTIFELTHPVRELQESEVQASPSSQVT